VVRVNDMGCLFQTDHVVDDRATRFDHTAVLDSFTAAGRSFVVTAGTDAGVTVLELLPDGHLQHFATGIFETGLGLAAVTGIEVAVNGTTVSIYVTDATASHIQKIDMSLATLGSQIDAHGTLTTGTAKADLLWGSMASEPLQGGGDDDFIFSGGGADVMAGGEGADLFVLATTTDNARITDYTPHIDHIDLSAWGHVYTAAALTITPTTTGAVLSLDGHDVTLVAGQALTAASFLDSDFVF
jgi:Ca2+-binding RTX toxin-like protein